MSTNTRGADLIAAALSRAGVQNVFTLSGNQIMPVFDACFESELRLIHVRHEAAAVHMADAWGRLTTEPGVAMVTAGPGFANTLSALYVALMAESPLVLISGHAPAGQLGHGAFQEMAQAEMAGHVCKASWTVAKSEQIGHDVARAFRMARSGRPGPVHVAVPFDLLNADIDSFRSAIPPVDDFHPLMSLLDVESATAILTALKAASRPLIVTGPTTMRGDGRRLLDELSTATGIPVVATESPRGINDPSLGAFAEVLSQADLVVLIGKKLDFTLRFGNEPAFHPECRIIHVDSETAVLERTSHNLSGSARLVGTELADAIPTLERLLQLASEEDCQKSEWCDEVESAIAYRFDDWSQLTSTSPGRMHAAQVCRGVNEFLKQSDDAVFISDGGEFGQWAQACISTAHRIINGPSGSIGSALPFAMAARLVFPDSVVVATLGDGTFGFHPFEFDTALRYELPFVAVVGNDACWNAEHQIQLRDYGPGRTHSCELNATAYDEFVRTLGGYGEQITKPEELHSALQRAVESRLPSSLNVAIDRLAAPVFRRN